MAQIELPGTCLVDTTFLVHLASPKSEFHANAMAYAQALQAHQTRFYLPTLVMAEYAVKAGSDGVSAVLGVLSAQVCGFDMRAALKYAELAQNHRPIFNVPVPEKERSIVDLMLVAIADTMSLESIITTDRNICGQFLNGTSTTALDIRKPITDLLPLWRDIQ